MNNKSHNIDLAARAAWMYYVYGINQDKIATTMGISRQRVQRLISLALKENLVNFTINHNIVECQKLSIDLKNKRYKPIILGKNGETIKKIRESSQNEISNIMKSKIHLYLQVNKVND